MWSHVLYTVLLWYHLLILYKKKSAFQLLGCDWFLCNKPLNKTKTIITPVIGYISMPHLQYTISTPPVTRTQIGYPPTSINL